MNFKILLSLLVLVAIVTVTECRRRRRRTTTTTTTSHVRRRHRTRTTQITTTTSTTTTTAQAADSTRNSLCVTEFGPCSTYYTPQCICVGRQPPIPFIILNWAVIFLKI